MGYQSSGSLTGMVRAAKAPTQRAVQRMAETGRDRLLAEARAATPERTGEMRDSWVASELIPLRDEHGRRGLAATVRNTDWRAGFVEYGTEDHSIRPKGTRGAKALDLPEGARGGADVSGIRARHMIPTAAAIVESTLSADVREHMEQWKQEIQAEMRRAR